jgi:hypothetical protein
MRNYYYQEDDIRRGWWGGVIDDFSRACEELRKEEAEEVDCD